MNIVPLKLKGAFLAKRTIVQDHRGMFERLFCEREFAAMNICRPIVQVNHSVTRKSGAIRGLHFQVPPKAEGKLITCIRGAVWDVMVDIRKGSETFLQWHAEVLSEENHYLVYLPEGFAHGFQTLADNSELIYFHTEFYHKENEGGICFDEPRLAIPWPSPCQEISDRDRNHPLLKSDFGGLEI